MAQLAHDHSGACARGVAASLLCRHRDFGRGMFVAEILPTVFRVHGGYLAMKRAGSVSDVILAYAMGVS